MPVQAQLQREIHLKGFGPETFGELYAEGYEAAEVAEKRTETPVTVEVLAELANGGKVLELAVGTGRVALPLAAKGLAVTGIEASEKMVQILREKPGGDAIPVAIGDMADVDVEGPFDLAFLIFNTISNLTSQEAQVRCFANVAKRLTPGGVFVVENFLPDLSKFIDGQFVRAQFAKKSSARIEIQMHDPLEQTIEYQRMVFTSDGTQLNPLVQRYVFPSEMDLMARLAGLRLRERWSGWDRQPFTSNSRSHVSVYELA